MVNMGKSFSLYLIQYLKFFLPVATTRTIIGWKPPCFDQIHPLNTDNNSNSNNNIYIYSDDDDASDDDDDVDMVKLYGTR